MQLEDVEAEASSHREATSNSQPIIRIRFCATPTCIGGYAIQTAVNLLMLTSFQADASKRRLAIQLS